MIIQTFNYYEKRSALPLFNTVSIKYAMLSAAQLKDSETLHHSTIINYRRNNLILRCTRRISSAYV